MSRHTGFAAAYFGGGSVVAVDYVDSLKEDMTARRTLAEDRRIVGGVETSSYGCPFRRVPTDRASTQKSEPGGKNRGVGEGRAAG